MKSEETGKDKIRKICDTLKKETLDPARQQVKEILENARLQAKDIIDQAKKEALTLELLAKEEIEQKKKIFESSLGLACNQALEDLKQKVKTAIFSENLKEVIDRAMSSPEVIARLISAILQALSEKGLDADFSIYIAKNVSPKEVNQYLLKNVLEKLKQKDLLIGDFAGGIRIKLQDKQMTLDLSSEAVRDLVVQYIRKDFREVVLNMS